MYLNRSEAEYLQAVKYFKKVRETVSTPEQRIFDTALEALRYAALRIGNPPLTREHLKRMHGQPVYLEQPVMGSDGQGGIVNCRDETILVLDHEGTYKDEWFHGINGGRYYRFPLNGVDLLKIP